MVAISAQPPFDHTCWPFRCLSMEKLQAAADAADAEVARLRPAWEQALAMQGAAHAALKQQRRLQAKECLSGLVEEVGSELKRAKVEKKEREGVMKKEKEEEGVVDVDMEKVEEEDSDDDDDNSDDSSSSEEKEKEEEGKKEEVVDVKKEEVVEGKKEEVVEEKKEEVVEEKKEEAVDGGDGAGDGDGGGGRGGRGRGRGRGRPKCTPAGWCTACWRRSQNLPGGAAHTYSPPCKKSR